ncbi:hypothetical protein F3J43_22385 [Pantoea sp. Cy-639]|nr:hypothetical protein [Pantoea sp. Cy-639]
MALPDRAGVQRATRIFEAGSLVLLSGSSAWRPGSGLVLYLDGRWSRFSFPPKNSQEQVPPRATEKGRKP